MYFWSSFASISLMISPSVFKRYMGSIVFFSRGVFVWLWNQSNTGLIVHYEVFPCQFFGRVQEALVIILEILVKFTSEVIWLWTFRVENFFIFVFLTDLTHFIVVCVCRFFFSVRFVNLFISRNLPISSNLLVYNCS